MLIFPFWNLLFSQVSDLLNNPQFIRYTVSILVHPEKVSLSICVKFEQSVKNQLVADVDVGAFLSGGLDSSTIVGFMSLYQSQPIKTFSVGFPDERFDESPYALAASHRFGTQHEINISSETSTKLWYKFRSRGCILWFV